MKKIFVVALIAATLASCSTLEKRLTEFDSTIHKYAPIVGKNLLLVGDILITAECSPLTPVAGNQASNILNIVAPNTSAATTVKNFFVTNSAVADELCPLVSAIRAGVGTVPKGSPSQVITTS